MWRFYLIATVIVVAIGSALVVRRVATLRGTLPIHATAANGTGRNPSAPQATFGGDGPWVMSALPFCFDQQSSLSGPTPLVAPKLPPPRERVAPGTVIRWNDCTLLTGEHDVRIRRGTDRLRVPPEARLYRRGESLILVWQSSGGRTEMRTYTRTDVR